MYWYWSSYISCRYCCCSCWQCWWWYGYLADIAVVFNSIGNFVGVSKSVGVFGGICVLPDGCAGVVGSVVSIVGYVLIVAVVVWADVKVANPVVNVAIGVIVDSSTVVGSAVIIVGGVDVVVIVVAVVVVA